MYKLESKSIQFNTVDFSTVFRQCQGLWYFHHAKRGVARSQVQALALWWHQGGPLHALSLRGQTFKLPNVSPDSVPPLTFSFLPQCRYYRCSLGEMSTCGPDGTKIYKSGWTCEMSLPHFCFQENAIEVFMKNGQSVFLVFLNKDHVFAYKRCITYSTWQDNSAKPVNPALISNRRKLFHPCAGCACSCRLWKAEASQRLLQTPGKCPHVRLKEINYRPICVIKLIWKIYKHRNLMYFRDINF